jgi:cyclophilin family peptidyl-prolyl cis-trans isomerase
VIDMNRAFGTMTLPLVAAAILAGCGGGGGGDPGPTVLTGVFIDSAVQGVKYESLDAQGTVTESGVTNASGTFRYRPGERVRFSIGELSLPTVTGASVVTPLDIAGTRQLDAPQLNNLLILLQSLDSDRNPGNGIQIAAAAAGLLTGTVASDLAQAIGKVAPDQFAALPGLADVVRGALGQTATPVTPLAARQHVAETLAERGDALPVVTQIAGVTWEGLDWLPSSVGSFYQGQKARIRVVGQALPVDLSIDATGACSQWVREDDKSVSTRAEFSCTPQATGGLSLAVRSAGQTLGTLTDTVATATAQAKITPITWAGDTSGVTRADFIYGYPGRIRVDHVMTGGQLSVAGTGVAGASGGCVGPLVEDLSARTAFRSEYLCTPLSLGSLTLSASSSGAALDSLATTVVEPQAPLPLVQFDISVPESNTTGYLLFELYPEAAPITVTNFLRYVEAKYYDGTVFHRVYPNFMFQAGGFNFTGGQYADKLTLFDPIVLERTTLTGLRNSPFTVAMARTPNPDSATSEFFINVVDNSSGLDTTASLAGYAVFARLVAFSQDDLNSANSLLNAIVAVQKVSNGSDSVPTRPVNPPVITRAIRIR